MGMTKSLASPFLRNRIKWMCDGGVMSVHQFVGFISQTKERNSIKSTA
jgi:hypothetical protein